jgi:serine/threonine protein kinase
MNELRAALNQYVAGTLPRGVTEQRVAAAAAKDPQLVPAMMALIETYRSAGGLNSEFAYALQNVLRTSSRPPAQSAPSGPSAASGPAASSPGSPGGTPATKLSPGSVLKGRFALEAIVSGGDQGGMGVVYKALDLIKQEAMDRNPYVAIKVLNESFKQHPDSMKALQREARRAQTLSHPNIINVHDFDRDGGNVFLVMELLDGSALDVLIRQYRPQGGMPLAEALPIIEGMGRALAHAHGRGIVHSDFKPGNAFLTSDNIVKVLDFGIARATQLGGGDKTLFDAGRLGALSPSYACPEQFEHIGPDPRDDVYALAVVTYELLTGRHPFERADPDNPNEIIKVDSVSARSERLKPAPIPTLSRRQWNALKSGLAYARHDRPRDAGAFLEGMLPRRLPVPTVLVVCAAALLVLVLSATMLSSYIERIRLQRVTQRLESSDPNVISVALQKLQSYPNEERSSVLVNPLVQRSLMGYFTSRAREQFDPSAGKYDYRDAIAGLKDAQELSPLYADSRQLNDVLDKVESERKSEIVRQSDQFEARLKRGVLIAGQGPNNAQAALAVIAQLDPQHPLLTDKRLPYALAAQTRERLNAGNLAQATMFLEAALALSPGLADLRDLQDQVHRRQEQMERAAQLAALGSRLAPLAADGATLEDFRAQRAPLNELQRSLPASPVLTGALAHLSTLLAAAISADLKQQQIEQAGSVLREFGYLLPYRFVATERAAIDTTIARANAVTPAVAAPKVADSPPPPPPPPSRPVNVEDQEVQGLIAALSTVPQTDDASVSAALGSLQTLEGLVGRNDERVHQLRMRISRAYLQQSQGLLTDHLLTESQRVLDLGQKFGLAPALYNTQESSLRQARARLQADNQKQTAASQLEASKRRIIDQAQADQIGEAESQLATLAKSLPAGDPFISTQAPQAIGDAYLSRAQKFFAQARFEDAVQAARQAQLAAPALAQFEVAAQRYQDARSLAVTLSSIRDPREFDKFKPVLDRLRAADPSGYPSFESGFVHILSDRINALDPVSAARVRSSVMRLFPDVRFGQS